MKIGIAVDAWKLPIFERNLKQAGYEFENCGELCKDVLLLRVDTPNAEALFEVTAGANAEAAREKRIAAAKVERMLRDAEPNGRPQ